MLKCMGNEKMPFQSNEDFLRGLTRKSGAANSLAYLLRFVDASSLGELLERKGYDAQEHVETLVDLIRNAEKDGDQLRAHHELSRVIESSVQAAVLKPSVAPLDERMRVISGECRELPEGKGEGALEEFLNQVVTETLETRRPQDAESRSHDAVYATGGERASEGTSHRPPHDTGCADGGISAIRDPGRVKE